MGVRCFGPYVWTTYAELDERILAFGAGLADIGLKPGQESFLGVYSKNCIEASQFGCVVKQGEVFTLLQPSYMQCVD